MKQESHRWRLGLNRGWSWNHIEPNRVTERPHVPGADAPGSALARVTTEVRAADFWACTVLRPAVEPTKEEVMADMVVEDTEK